MKTAIIGDIHGRPVWKDIIEREKPDRTIFLGDYVSTHEGIGASQQLRNLDEILDYAEAGDCALLRGNHDMQHLGYPWAKCSAWQGGAGDLWLADGLSIKSYLVVENGKMEERKL